MRVWRAPELLTLILTTVLVTGGCSQEQEIDRTPELTTTLRQIVAGPAIGTVQDAVWTDVRSFYHRREGAPAWVSDEDLSAATDALKVLQSARAHGFAPEDYGEPQLTERLGVMRSKTVRLKPDTTIAGEDAPDRLQQLAELDVRLTTGLLAFARDVAAGRSTPAALDRRWKARRELPDLVGTLNHAATGDLKSWIDTVRPQHPEYAALQQALISLQEQQATGGWERVSVETLAPGGSDPAVVTLRRRLTASGHLNGASASDTSPVYTGADEAGVRAFQELHALKGTGVVDAATLAAMNVPLADRIRQVELNLERWRWMPDDLGARHLLVNIPYFHVIAREDGKSVMDIRVVVGKADEHKTPVFSSEMSTVVFSPFWNIPESIVKGETAPAVARDPAYLAKNNIEVLDASMPGLAPVDSASVNWDDASQLRRLAFRQRPGPGNALGHVKFLFPNQFDVYLHDTPADKLFARQGGRAFSHGCVRVEEPEALARYVLRGYSEWDDTRILEAMHSGVEKHVKLKKSIPVHIVYFTAWVDENGGLHFQPDVYKYDEKQSVADRT